MAKKYIVAYMLTYPNNEHETEYEVFAYDTSEINYKQASDRYTELLANDDTYSASLTEILESTDY